MARRQKACMVVRAFLLRPPALRRHCETRHSLSWRGVQRRPCHFFPQSREIPLGATRRSVIRAADQAGGLAMDNARVNRADRRQPALEIVDIERLVPEDHRVRAVWAFVESLDLGMFYARIKARGETAGRP